MSKVGLGWATFLCMSMNYNKLAWLLGQSAVKCAIIYRISFIARVLLP
jgi:hypothetical protein